MATLIHKMVTTTVVTKSSMAVLGVEPGVWATILAAMIAAMIAYRQWRTAETKLRLDLYDRRLPIYLATRKLMAAVTQGNTEYKALFDYYTAIQEAPFVMPQDANDYLSMIGLNAGKLIASQHSGRKAPAGHALRQKAIDEDYRWSSWFTQQYEVIEARFANWMRLEAGFTFRGQQLLYVLSHLRTLAEARKRREKILRDIEEEIARDRKAQATASTA